MNLKMYLFLSEEPVKSLGAPTTKFFFPQTETSQNTCEPNSVKKQHS